MLWNYLNFESIQQRHIFLFTWQQKLKPIQKRAIKSTENEMKVNITTRL